MTHSTGERDQLPGRVRDALNALRSVPDIDPEVWEENRGRFLAEARAYAEAAGPQEQSHGLVTGTSVGILGWWTAVRSVFSPGVRRTRLATAALKVMLVMAIVLGGSVGTVSAARGSLPGSPLYPIKVRLEQWEMTQAHTPEDVSQRALVQSQKRLDEATRLADGGKTVPDDVAVRFQEQLSLAVQASGTLAEPERLQTRTRISETLQYQIQTMAEIAARVQGEDEGGDSQAILAMIRTMQQTQAQLGPGYGRSDDPGEGEPRHNGPDQEPGDGVCAGSECPDAPGDVIGDGPGPDNGNGPSDNPASGSPDDGKGPRGPGEPSEHGNGQSEPADGRGPRPNGGRLGKDGDSDAYVVPDATPNSDDGVLAAGQGTSSGQMGPVAANVTGRRAGQPNR